MGRYDTTRVFEANTYAGACAVSACGRPWTPGAFAVFATGRKLDRDAEPMTAREFAIFLVFAKVRKASRARREAPPIPPVFVWEHMTCPACAERLGFKVPRRADGTYLMTAAYTGTRTVGHADGRAANV